MRLTHILLALSLHAALTQAAQAAAIMDFAWTNGQPPIRMTGALFSTCALSGISGKLAGGGERVEIWKGSDNFWYLGGSSMQGFLRAKATCVQHISRKGVNWDVVETGWFGYNGSAHVNNPVNMQQLGVASCPVGFITAVAGAFNRHQVISQVFLENANSGYTFRAYPGRNSDSASGYLLAKGVCLKKTSMTGSLTATAVKRAFATKGLAYFETMHDYFGGYATNQKHFCALSSIEGIFEGGGELLEIQRPAGENAAYALEVRSMQKQTGGTVRCIKFNQL